MSMMELNVDKEWKPFYAVLQRDDTAGDDDVIDLRLLHEMDEVVYGKYSSGYDSDGCIWKYVWVKKTQLRALPKVSITIF
jgi:hypothetical protein